MTVLRMARKVCRHALPSVSPIVQLLEKIFGNEAKIYRVCLLTGGAPARFGKTRGAFYKCAEMNHLLETTDTSFGRVIAELKPLRQTFAVEILLKPLDDGWESRPPPPDHPG